jgi:hypothetical protein
MRYAQGHSGLPPLPETAPQNVTRNIEITCASCLHGRATEQLQIAGLRLVRGPGQSVSINQLESTVHNLATQMKGCKSTESMVLANDSSFIYQKERSKAHKRTEATVFTNHLGDWYELKTE